MTIPRDPHSIVILCDIDGTFIDSCEKVPETNRRALERFKAAGGRFGFASGRIPDTIRHVIPDWRELANVPCILCNGAYVYRPGDGSLAHEMPLDGRRALPMVRRLKAEFPMLKIRYTVRGGVVYIQNEKDGDPDDVWYKIVIEGPGVEDRLHEAREWIRGRCEEEYAISYSWSDLLELLHPDATKGAMLRWLRQTMGDPFVIACGDYGNDIAMLQEADLPVCPSNAQPEIVEVCRQRGLVLCGNDDGLLGDLMTHILP